MEVLLTVPVTISGLPGLGPWMYFSTIFFSSARRQRQSDFLLIFVPSSLANRSGSWLAMFTSAGSATVQSSP